MHEQTTKEFGKMNICITRFGIRIGDRKCKPVQLTPNLILSTHSGEIPKAATIKLVVSHDFDMVTATCAFPNVW